MFYIQRHAHAFQHIFDHMYLVILYITASRRVAKINGIFTILVFRLMCAVHVYLWHIHKPIKAYVYVRVCACMCMRVHICLPIYIHTQVLFFNCNLQ